MKTTQEYNKQQACKQEVDEPIAGYGTIDALKVKLVKRIMGMEALEDVQSVLNFVERQKVSETFEQEWERGVTLEQFRDACKGKLKSMQTCEIRILPEAEDFLTLLPQTLVKEGYGRILVKHITNNWVEGQYIR